MALALIEDDYVQRLSMEAQLSRLGAEVTTFSSGEEFLRKGCSSIEQGFTPWDLIIVDYVMPEMNGIETISSLPSEVTDTSRVCVVSGNDLGAQDQSYLDTRDMIFVRKMPSACRQIWSYVNKSSSEDEASDSSSLDRLPSSLADEVIAQLASATAFPTPVNATTGVDEVFECVAKADVMPKNPQLVSKASSMPNLLAGAAVSARVACLAVVGVSAPVITATHTHHHFKSEEEEAHDEAGIEGVDAEGLLGGPEEMLSPEQLATVVNVLQDVAAFRTLAREKFTRLVQSARLSRFTPGEVIATEQCFYPYCSIILEGKIQVSRHGKGILGEMAKGKWFGNFIRSRLAMATVLTVKDTILAQISYQEYEAIFILNQAIPVPQVRCTVGLEDIRLSAKPLGCGTFAEVYRCSMQGSAWCALKCIRKKTVVELGATTQVMNEIKLLKCLKHPYIASFHGVLQDLSRVYLLQELVPGGELFEYLEQRDVMQEGEARFYLANVCVALEYVHSKGVLYRDLKPENLVFGADGYLKLVDFGFAKQLPANGMTHTLCGTPEYVAPEIIGRRGYNYMVDFWSAGILLYEMLTGCTPYAADGDVFAMYELMSTRQLSLPPGCDLSADARACVWGLLSKDPDSRLGQQQQLRNHSWYEIKNERGQYALDWSKVENGQHQAPYVPAQKQLDGVFETIQSILPPSLAPEVPWNPVV